jgi:L-asparaginase / beta-aspartyl-peptidase
MVTSREADVMRLFVVLGAVLVGCAPVPAPIADPTPELRTLLDQSARAWNAGDLDGFMITYARDSATTFMTAKGPIYGYEAIRARYAPRFEPGAERDSLRFTDLVVRPLDTDYAIATARYVLERGDSVTATGPFTVVLRREREGWRMIHDHTS